MDLNTKQQFTNLTSLTRRWMQTLNNKIESMHADIVQHLQNLSGSLSMRIDAIHTTVAQRLEYAEAMLTTINNHVIDTKNDIVQQLQDLSGSLVYRVNNIMTYIDTLPQDIAAQLKGYFTSLQKSLDQTLEKIPALQQSLDQIVEKIPKYEEIEIVQKPQIEVEVGQQQILVQDYATMTQAFSAKMAWVPQIFDFLAELESVELRYSS